MDARDIGTRFFHLPKILFYHGPLGIPMVFDRPKLVIAVTVETPGENDRSEGSKVNPSPSLATITHGGEATSKAGIGGQISITIIASSDLIVVIFQV